MPVFSPKYCFITTGMSDRSGDERRGEEGRDGGEK